MLRVIGIEIIYRKWHSTLNVLNIEVIDFNRVRHTAFTMQIFSFNVSNYEISFIMLLQKYSQMITKIL